MAYFDSSIKPRHHLFPPATCQKVFEHKRFGIIVALESLHVKAIQNIPHSRRFDAFNANLRAENESKVSDASHDLSIDLFFFNHPHKAADDLDNITGYLLEDGVNALNYTIYFLTAAQSPPLGAVCRTGSPAPC
jgi:hypothetical protein